MNRLIIALFLSSPFLVFSQAPDMTVVSIVSPDASIYGPQGNPDSAMIQCIVANVGSPPGNTALSGSVTVYYSINGGTPVGQILTAMLSAQATWNLQFDPVDLSACDTFNIAVWAYHADDPNHNNDTAYTQLVNPCASTASLGEEEAMALEAYPNPTSGLLHLPGSATGTVRITLLNGAVVMEVEAQPILDISGLDAGYYLMAFEAEGQKHTQRILKE